MLVSKGMRFILKSSKKLYVGRLVHCKELWGHPWDDHIQTLPLLDTTSLEMKVGSSMIQGSQTVSFSPRHRLQDSLLAHPPLLKRLDLRQKVTFWYQVDENPLFCWFERSLENKLLSFECFRMWMICIGSKRLKDWIFIEKRCVKSNWLQELLDQPRDKGIWCCLENCLMNERNMW